MMTRLARGQRRPALAADACHDRMIHARPAIRHEGELQDHARRGHQRIRPRMDFPQRARPLRRNRKIECLLAQIVIP